MSAVHRSYLADQAEEAAHHHAAQQLALARFALELTAQNLRTLARAARGTTTNPGVLAPWAEVVNDALSQLTTERH